MISFTCDCGKNLLVKDELTGKKVRCPLCQKVLTKSNWPWVLCRPVGLPLATAAAPTDPFATSKAVNVPSRSKGGDETLSGTSPTSPLASFLAPPQAGDEIGRLAGYRVLRILGKGGMGTVLEAEDPRLKRRIALKVLLPKFADDLQAKQRFLREAQAAAALEHDHIITILQVGEDAGIPFLAMPLLKGETLDGRMKREGKLPIAGEALPRVRAQTATVGPARHDRILRLDSRRAHAREAGPRVQCGL